MKYSASLRSRLTFVVERAIGSNGVLAFYNGPAPATADDEPTGEKLGTRALTPAELGELRNGRHPEMMQGAGYYRLLDNGGLTVLQGDCSERRKGAAEAAPSPLPCHATPDPAPPCLAKPDPAQPSPERQPNRADIASVDHSGAGSKRDE